MLKSHVLKVNMKHVIFNWIKFYFWDGKNVKDSFQNTLTYYRKMTDVEQDITSDEIKKYIIDYIQQLENESAMNNLIKELKFTHIKRSFKDLMEDAELNFNNKKELQQFIINEIIPVVTTF
jgi:galactokinase/mevalonate kinase-like predicted kinase